AIAPHHSRALQLRKLRKPANANGAHRLAPNLRYKMRRARKIVAVELFVERTILLAHVNNAAPRIDLRQLIQRPHNVDNDRAHAAAAFISSPTKGASRPSYRASCGSPGTGLKPSVPKISRAPSSVAARVYPGIAQNSVSRTAIEAFTARPAPLSVEPTKPHAYPPAGVSRGRQISSGSGCKVSNRPSSSARMP